MVHGDDEGLMLPPAVAPLQVVIIPIAMHKGGVREKASELYDVLRNAGIRAKLDDTDKMPGWKFSEYEMKGVPLRIEIGPRDIENGQCVFVARNNRIKETVRLEDVLLSTVKKLDLIQKEMYDSALSLREEKTYTAVDMDAFEKIINETPGFIKAMWCGSEGCEDEIKEKTGASARCIPFSEDPVSDKCVCCGADAKKLVYFARAY
jgi:prolyl-tRNA synthetase